MTKSSMNDTSVRIVEGDVFSGASSSQAPTRSPLPVPTPTFEPGEATEVDGDMVMADDDTDVRDTHVANDVVDGLDPAPPARSPAPPLPV